MSRATENLQKDRAKMWLSKESQAVDHSAEDESFYRSSINKISDHLPKMWQETKLFVEGK